MAWVTRPEAGQPLDPFDPDDFVVSRQTLYLLSKDGAGAAAPLVGALADRVVRAATKAAERRGGRLDPPALLVLDEAANVCRIADLPELYSHLGSRGIVPLTILQSYKQGARVWGDAGMDALWSAATVKIIGAGIDDAKFAEDISRLIGEHDVRVRSTTRGDGSWSSSTSLRQQRVMTAADVRALPRGRALLFVTGVRPAQVRLRPWYEGKRAGEVRAAVEAAEAELTRRAGSTSTAGAA
jgi:type IV secretory pathway TraG/TraD family ATPase VirD4